MGREDRTSRSSGARRLSSCSKCRPWHFSWNHSDSSPINTKNPSLSKGKFISSWCPRWDLNPHTRRHTHLKRTCLPFHHLGIYRLTKNVWYVYLSRMSSRFAETRSRRYDSDIIAYALRLRTSTIPPPGQIFDKQRTIWKKILRHDFHRNFVLYTGAPSRVRTYNQRFRRPLLFQLSYGCRLSYFGNACGL